MAKSPQELEEDDSPSLVHYLIVLGAIVGTILLLYVGFEVYDSFQTKEDLNLDELRSSYIYDHKVGNVTYQVKFSYPFEELESLNYTFDINELDVLNTLSYSLVFHNYSGIDNGYVSVAASKFLVSLKQIYYIGFGDIVEYGNLTCANSTKQRPIVIFEPNENISGIFQDEGSYCIHVKSQGAQEMPKVVDSFIYSLLSE